MKSQRCGREPELPEAERWTVGTDRPEGAGKRGGAPLLLPPPSSRAQADFTNALETERGAAGGRGRESHTHTHTHTHSPAHERDSSRVD